MAHVFATGGEPSESEREIVVGGLATVPTSVFAGIDYAALGHLHGPQRLAEHVRYSGSPLPYSFSEERHRKSSWLVELGAIRPRARRGGADAGASASWPAFAAGSPTCWPTRGSRGTSRASCRSR